MFSLTILGNNSALPAYGRHPTAQYLQSKNVGVLIDCGEGTQSQIAKFKIRKSNTDHIFISHLHGDHYFGLIGLLTSMALNSRTEPISIYAPALLKNIIELQLEAANSILPFSVSFHALEDGCGPFLLGEISAEAFPVSHRIPCWGFLFKEIKKPRHVNAERAKIYEIPYSFYGELQNGKDFKNAKGTIVPNEEVTFASPPPKTYAYCADTKFDENICPVVNGADLLYHETTYLRDMIDKAATRFHSTTDEAARIAKKAGVKKLLIGHFSSRHETLEKFLEETRETFPATELAQEGTCFMI